MDLSDLSLKIYCMSHKGIMPLVSVGISPDCGVLRTTLNEPLHFVLHHDETYVQYALYSTKVCTDTGIPATLVVNLFLTSGKQLALRRSPYSLLKVIYESFLAFYLKSDDNGVYQIPNQIFDSTPLKNIIGQYKVLPRKDKYIPMRGKENASFAIKNDAQLEALFRDSQYEELANFKYLEIGFNCQSTVKLSIPRKRIYPVWLNGTDTGITLTENEDSYVSDLKSNEWYVYENVSFTLEEILEASGAICNGLVNLETSTGRIVCQIPQRLREYQFDIKYDTDLDDEELRVIKIWLKKGKLSLKLDEDRDISLDCSESSSIILKGEEVKQGASLNVTSLGPYAFDVTKEHEWEEDNLNGKGIICLKVLHKNELSKNNFGIKEKILYGIIVILGFILLLNVDAIFRKERLLTKLGEENAKIEHVCDSLKKELYILHKVIQKHNREKVLEKESFLERRESDKLSNKWEDKAVALVNHCIGRGNFTELHEWIKSKPEGLGADVKEALEAMYWGYPNVNKKSPKNKNKYTSAQARSIKQTLKGKNFKDFSDIKEFYEKEIKNILK